MSSPLCNPRFLEHLKQSKAKAKLRMHLKTDRMIDQVYSEVLADLHKFFTFDDGLVRPREVHSDGEPAVLSPCTIMQQHNQSSNFTPPEVTTVTNQSQNSVHQFDSFQTSIPLCNETSIQPPELRPFLHPTMSPNVHMNFEVLSSESTGQSQHSTSLPTTIVNDQSNHNLNEQNLNEEDEDAGECYCDECLDVIEIDDEVEDDDDSDSVQCIEDEQELAQTVKKPRMDSTQPDNSQPEVSVQAQRKPTEDVQSNEVVDHDKQIITVHLRCPESECPGTFTENELNDHLMDEHSIGPNRCLVKQCKQSFNNPHILGQHLKQFHKGTTKWHCDKCEHHFTSYRLLSTHNHEFHQLGHFQCSFASCTFTGECRRKVYAHYAQQHKPTLKCQYSACHYRTMNSTHFKAHERAHLGIQPYRCKWTNCDYSHASRNYTMIHINRIHFNPQTSSSNVALSGKPADYLEVVHSLL